MKKLILAASAVLLITGCEDLDQMPDWGIGDTASDGYDTGYDTAYDSNPTGSPPRLEEVYWNCDPSRKEWTYTARTSGWAGLISLDIHETGSTVPWTEYHELRNSAWSESGTWDEWAATLVEVDQVDHVFPGRTTLFDCGYHGDDSLTWLYATYDDEGQTISCVSTGHRPSYWTNEQGYYSCETW